MIQTKELICRGLCYEPRGGLSVDIRNDPWVLGEGDGRPRWHADAGEIPVNFSVADLFNFDTNSWNRPLIHFFYLMRLPRMSFVY